MLSELIFLDATSPRWLKTPDAPICEISLIRATSALAPIPERKSERCVTR